EGWGLAGFLSLPWSLGKTADGTGAHAAGFRCRCRFRWSAWRQIEFRPYALAGDRSEGHAPAVGEGLDEEQAASGLLVRGGHAAVREGVTSGVRDLDAQGRAVGQEGET